MHHPSGVKVSETKVIDFIEDLVESLASFKGRSPRSCRLIISIEILAFSAKASWVQGFLGQYLTSVRMSPNSVLISGSS